MLFLCFCSWNQLADILKIGAAEKECSPGAVICTHSINITKTKAELPQVQDQPGV